MHRREKGVPRREFLYRVAAAAVGGAIATFQGERAAFPAEEDPVPKNAGIVVDIRSEAIVDEGRQVVYAVLEEMLNTALMRLTGKDTVEAAWKEFVSPNEVVGLKFNGVSRDYCQSNEMMLKAIVTGLKSIGVKEENIVPIEHQIKGLQGSFAKPDMGLDRVIDFGAGRTQLKKYLTQQVDVLINLPDLKHHHAAGVTIALKNVSHGVISNPGDLHDNSCDPYIGYINALPVVLQKRRLNICNGIRGVFDNGPMTDNPQLQFHHHGLLVSTDPVALDAVGRELVDEARRKKNMRPIGDMARSIETAASIGLGTSDRRKMEVIQVTVNRKGEGQ